MRRVDVTASDVAALFGLSPFKTVLQLYLDKTRPQEQQSDNNLLRRGRWLEAAALSAINDEYSDWQCRKADVYLRDKRLRIGATPDLFKASGEPVEIKAPSPISFKQHWHDAPPINYQLQALLQAMLTNQPQTTIVAFVVSGFDANLHTFTVKRNLEAENKLVKAVKAFWLSVADQQPPRADYSRDGAALTSLYQNIDAAKSIDLSMSNRIGQLCDERLNQFCRTAITP